MQQYELRENDSKVYYNSSKWKSNNCGEFTVIGKLNKYDLVNGRKKYRVYLCQFEDGTIVEAYFSAIHIGNVSNPNSPSVHDIGYIGEGQWKASTVETGKRKITKEYCAWSSMIQRCYSEKYQAKFPTYKECTVHERWHSFQNFCEDIQELENYQQWKDNDGWELDKDIKVTGNKVYSKNTCMFVLETVNTNEMNKRTEIDKLTGLVYMGISPTGEEYEFINQAEFARQHNLYQGSLNNCLNGRLKTHKGWTFKVKE